MALAKAAIIVLQSNLCIPLSASQHLVSFETMLPFWLRIAMVPLQYLPVSKRGWLTAKSTSLMKSHTCCILRLKRKVSACVCHSYARS